MTNSTSTSSDDTPPSTRSPCGTGTHVAKAYSRRQNPRTETGPFVCDLCGRERNKDGLHPKWTKVDADPDPGEYFELESGALVLNLPRGSIELVASGSSIALPEEELHTIAAKFTDE